MFLVIVFTSLGANLIGQFKLVRGQGISEVLGSSISVANLVWLVQP